MKTVALEGALGFTIPPLIGHVTEMADGDGRAQIIRSRAASPG